MINNLFSSCRGSGMRIIPQGVDHMMGYNNYTQLLKLNNDFYNNTDCITLLAVAKPYQNIKVSVSGSDTNEVGLTIKGISRVLDIVHTKDTRTKDKYFALVEMLKFAQTEAAIGSVFNALAEAIKNCTPGTTAIENVIEYPSVKSGYRTGGQVNLAAESVHPLVAETHSQPISWKQ